MNGLAYLALGWICAAVYFTVHYLREIRDLLEKQAGDTALREKP